MTRLRILADENIPGVAEAFAGFGSIQQCSGRAITPERLEGIDILLVRSITRVDGALLGGSAVSFVGTATSGYDHVDREYLAQQEIGFAHAPGANANSVVEYIIAAIAYCGDALESLFAGARLGIVGQGHIGSALTDVGEALGWKWLAHDPWLGDDPRLTSLEAVLACEVVSLHPALTQASPWPSYHLLGAAQLSVLSPGCLLINASRGEVIDNQALLALLVAGTGLQVVLDVWEGEPRVNPVLLENVVLGSAHIAGYSMDGKLLATHMLACDLAHHRGAEGASIAATGSPLPVLELPPGLTGAALLRHLITASYTIQEDDQRLRQALNSAPESEHGKAFDQLRKKYPVRRELRGRRVSLEDATKEAIQILRATGCLTPDGTPW